MVIEDGQRENLVLRMDGHFHGADAVEKLLDWCEEINIKIITLYVFCLPRIWHEMMLNYIIFMI